jgi:hypothetical protein
MTDSSVRLPMDSLGKALMGYDFDFEMLKVAMYKDDGAGGVELWDGTVDILVTGDFYLELDDVEELLTDIKTAVEIVDNFISGARGLVTEDNSADILTALQTIDNFISGSRGLVTEDNSAAILSAVQDQRSNYKYTGFLEDGTDVYVAYEDEDGAYYIEKHPSSGLVTFTAGTGGVPATGTWTGLSYASFASTF